MTTWEAVGRALATNELALRELERQRRALIGQRRELEQALVRLAARDRLRLTASDTDDVAATAEMRVPEWAAERRRFMVEPGHGAETSRLKTTAPLSELSTATPCPSGCTEQALHTHYADGVTAYWNGSGLLPSS